MIWFCDHCGHETETRVLNTREKRRRRECLECGETFPTIEVKARRVRKPRHRTPSKQMVFDLTPLPAA